MSVKQKLLFLFVILFFITEIATKFEFTNLKCSCPVEDLCSVEHCYLKSINRTYKYASIKVNIFKPINNVQVNSATFKHLNGYKPFLYNVTIDGCRFMENRNRNPIANFLFGFLGTYHNLNHTCPFNDFILIDKLPISQINRHTMVLQFPNGNYLVKVRFYTDGILGLAVQFYGTLS